ncbi:MAG: hypothetical protein VXW55_02110 [Candidatus Thermoplasmatota archaeon]|nr:hypothetical protein [Candidatus Thermoplasmatota archaeon]
MNSTIKWSLAIFGIIGFATLYSSFAYVYPVGRVESVDCDKPTVVFSEFKEENDTGIYTTEILEYESSENCRFTSSWGYFFLYLLDNQGNIYHKTVYPIANYEGGNQNHINLTSAIANDTKGAEYPVRIMNEMNGPYESYSDSNNKTKGNDKSMKMSVGDTIMVYGSGDEADGPAKQGWSLRIMYVPPGPSDEKILTDDLVIP